MARTCPTGASTVHRFRRRSGPVAARARGPSPATTKTRRQWASRQRGSHCGRRTPMPVRARCGSRPPSPRTSTRTTRRRCTPRFGSMRTSALSTSGVRSAQDRARCEARSTPAATCWSSPPIGVRACPRVRTRHRAATARPRSSSAATPTGLSSPSTSVGPARPRSSLSGGARPAPLARGSGRSGSARSCMRRSSTRRGTTR